MFWLLNFLVNDFSAANDVVVRAMDEGMNVWPREHFGHGEQPEAEAILSAGEVATYESNEPRPVFLHSKL